MKKFTLYMGLNDKDAKVQVISTIEAYKVVSNIIAKDFGGGTIFEAQGIYKHDDGKIVFEKTLRIEILFAEEPHKGFSCRTKEDIQSRINRRTS